MAWPTTNDPRTEFITVRLTASEAEDLDKVSQIMQAPTRSQTVRYAVEKLVEKHLETPTEPPARLKTPETPLSEFPETQKNKKEKIEDPVKVRPPTTKSPKLAAKKPLVKKPLVKKPLVKKSGTAA